MALLHTRDGSIAHIFLIAVQGKTSNFNFDRSYMPDIEHKFRGTFEVVLTTLTWAHTPRRIGLSLSHPHQIGIDPSQKPDSCSVSRNLDETQSGWSLSTRSKKSALEKRRRKKRSKIVPSPNELKHRKK